MQVGLLGTGRIGRVHALSLMGRVPGARLGMVFDADPTSAERCVQDFGATGVAADAHEVLSSSEVDAVLVCTPADTHADFVIRAASAGKAVFCEKPLALDLAEVDRILAVVESSGVPFQVGFNRRFDPSFRAVQETVASGGVGEPHMVRITSRDNVPPPLAYVQVSGGIFLDMAIHDFDMARYLMGQEVEEVYATGSVLVDPEIGRAGDLDTTAITLRFKNGALGMIDNSRQAVYGYDQRVEVFGSEGMAACSNETPHRAYRRDERHTFAANPQYDMFARYTESYVAEMFAFVECVRKGKEPEVTGRDGRVPLVMGLAAMRSVAERRPVRLDEIDPGEQK